MNSQSGRRLRTGNDVLISQHMVQEMGLSTNKAKVIAANYNTEQLVQVEVADDAKTRLDLHAKSLRHAPNFMEELEKKHPVILNAREWVQEGWGIEGDPTPEQIATALLHEATTADSEIGTGSDTIPDYPIHLRAVAKEILQHFHPSLFELA